jgi:hypothetical protein
MSEIITTRSLGYSIDQGQDETDFIARLINPNRLKADMGFFDPGTGVLCVYTTSSGHLEQFDSGYPTDDFLISMRNRRNEKGLPLYEIVVEELGLDVAAGNTNIESPERPLHKMKVMSLEDSPIIAFSRSGYSNETGRYIYQVSLENGHQFNLSAKSSRSETFMDITSFDADNIYIDGVKYNFFARYKEPEAIDDPAEFAEKISKRIKYLIKIYFDRNINITLENQG